MNARSFAGSEVRAFSARRQLIQPRGRERDCQFPVWIINHYLILRSPSVLAFLNYFSASETIALAWPRVNGLIIG